MGWIDLLQWPAMLAAVRLRPIRNLRDLFIRRRYMQGLESRAGPRQPWLGAYSHGRHRGLSTGVASGATLSILEFERQHLMEPEALRHGQVSAAVASSIGSRSLRRRLSRRDNKNDKGNPQ